MMWHRALSLFCTLLALLQAPGHAMASSFANEFFYRNTDGVRLHFYTHRLGDHKGKIDNIIISTWNDVLSSDVKGGIPHTGFWEQSPFEWKNIIEVQIGVNVEPSESCHILAAISIEMKKGADRPVMSSMPPVPICSTEESLEQDIRNIIHSFIRWHLASPLNKFNRRK